MKVYKKDNKIIFEFSEFEKRFNPWGSDKENKDGVFGYYPTFTGLIVRHRENQNDYDEIGFAGTIDMDYKGKADQVSDFIVKWFGEEEEFKKLCSKLNIGIEEMTFK